MIRLQTGIDQKRFINSFFIVDIAMESGGAAMAFLFSEKIKTFLWKRPRKYRGF